MQKIKIIFSLPEDPEIAWNTEQMIKYTEQMIKYLINDSKLLVHPVYIFNIKYIKIKFTIRPQI